MLRRVKGKINKCAHLISFVYTMAKLISARIPDEALREIEKLSKARHTGKTEVIRKLLLRGLAESKLERALDLYRGGNVTLWRAAQLADLSLWRFLEEVKRRKIPVDYSLEDAQKDVKAVFG